jgi:peptidoglycan/LPS O-acetylase OafA/YrhL
MLRAVLSFKPLVGIGTASYSIYLVHEPVVSFLQRRLALTPQTRMALAYAAAIVTGMLFWALFERVWMSGSLKNRAVAALEPRIGAFTHALEVASDLRFEPARHTAAELGIE